ncbi:hypothetical protein [Quadrisphaera sp. INWT6]|uniref:hypothetical protein n=1 Tax=Quadrisphaera sp. INWT6 TaxID=2596917 RepID=UPI0018923F53|nr:hypothetical protein [Quadrisphaera sp. INWT6]MBF5083752.1 hypothetical protein [Quadrisphaera sp. INWT6]
MRAYFRIHMDNVEAATAETATHFLDVEAVDGEPLSGEFTAMPDVSPFYDVVVVSLADHDVHSMSGQQIDEAMRKQWRAVQPVDIVAGRVTEDGVSAIYRARWIDKVTFGRVDGHMRAEYTLIPHKPVINELAGRKVIGGRAAVQYYRWWPASGVLRKVTRQRNGVVLGQAV